MKKYREFDEVVKDTYVPKGLYEFEKIMKEKPNFDKKNFSQSQRVYEKNEFIILKVKKKNKIGFIAYNKKKGWEKGHTHLNSLDMAKTIINNVSKRKKPRTNNLYLLRSHARLSCDDKYAKFIEELISSKKNKGKKTYINRR